jgi:hypothetical protein
LIGEHPDAFRYDWRIRFGLPLEAIFDGRMTYAEAWSLTCTLARDPSSQVGAALAGWRYPASREALTLADTYDLVVAANTPAKSRGRIKPYPRPWRDADTRRSTQPRADQTTVRAALAARGH